MVEFITQDWANILLVAAALVFILIAAFGIFMPIFGGATATDDEASGMAMRIAAIVAAVPLILYGIVWLLRGVSWILRLIVCDG